MSEVVQTHIQRWRASSRDGTITTEEMRQAIAQMRQERLGAGVVSAASKVKKVAAAKKAEPINSDDLLAGLM